MNVETFTHIGKELVDRRMEAVSLEGRRPQGFSMMAPASDLHQQVDLGFDIPQADAGRRDEGSVRAGNPDAQISGPADGVRDLNARLEYSDSSFRRRMISSFMVRGL